MERRDFLYVTGVGLVAGTGSIWVSGNKSQEPMSAVAVDPAAAARSSVRTEGSGHTVTLAGGAAFSMRHWAITSEPQPGDLRYQTFPDGSARLDVIGYQPRIASSETKSTENFEQLAADGAFELPRWDTRPHASEAMVYNVGDATRLGRMTASNTFTLIQRDDGEWSAVHVREADSDQLVIHVIERANASV